MQRKGASVIKGILTLALGIVILVAIARGCTSTTTPPQTPTNTPAVTSPPVETKPRLVLNPNWKWKNEEYARYIVGTVKNESTVKADYAQITFTLFDKDGNQVGSTFTNINDLAGGGTWSFKALVFEDSATMAKFSEITAY
jgi:hypothetical protein